MLRRHEFFSDGPGLIVQSSQEELDQAMAELKAYIYEFMRKLGGQDGPRWAKSQVTKVPTPGGFGDTLTYFDHI